MNSNTTKIFRISSIKLLNLTKKLYFQRLLHNYVLLWVVSLFAHIIIPIVYIIMILLCISIGSVKNCNCKRTSTPKLVRLEKYCKSICSYLQKHCRNCRIWKISVKLKLFLSVIALRLYWMCNVVFHIKQVLLLRIIDASFIFIM